jgi:hypothetical protein
LEPGQDGVGDYTAGFAEELRQQGHDVLAISLADRFVNEPVLMHRLADGGAIQTLRLPSMLQWPQRIVCAKHHVDKFAPEWVSLQFVCYGFHPKGLVHGLAGRLSPLLAGKKTHLMFHETWLCKELGFGWRQRTVGALQLFFIKRFVRATKPKLIHTSNAAYAGLLSRNGMPALELGLFGSVPVLRVRESIWLESQLKSALGNGYRRRETWLFGFFGGLHPQWPPEPLLTYLRQAARTAGKKPVLLSVGRIGEAGLDLWSRMARNYSDCFGFVRLGEQSTERISEYLSSLDCGIATSPRSIIGKSSTVVSMVEHGLPVIVNRDDAFSNGQQLNRYDPFLTPCDANLERKLCAGLKRVPRASRRPEVARDFVRDLEQAQRFASAAPVCVQRLVD